MSFNRSFRRREALATTVALVALSLAGGGAHAQSKGTIQLADAGDASALEEVTVTAQFREQN